MTAIPITRVVKVFAAGDSTFVIRRGGAVWAWGRFVYHRLPTGRLERCPESSDPCSSIPVPVTGLQHDVASLGVGVGFDYALMHSGKLLAWETTFLASWVGKRPSRRAWSTSSTGAGGRGKRWPERRSGWIVRPRH